MAKANVVDPISLRERGKADTGRDMNGDMIGEIKSFSICEFNI